MKTIELISLKIENFKGCSSATYEFANRTSIEGANGSGKSTIYEAYLWCLFGKNSNGNVVNVQPYDEKNELVHNLTTSVETHLTVDGSPVIICRKQVEEWGKPRGAVEVVLKGTKQERLINGVPMSVIEFNNKLSEFCPMEDWFNLSSINIIPSMKQDERRAILVKIAPEVNVKEMLEHYPAIKDALYQNIGIKELTALNKLRKAKAKADIEQIPARIDQQEKLRVDYDAKALQKEIDELTAQRNRIDEKIATIEAGAKDAASIEERAKLKEKWFTLEEKRVAIIDEARRERDTKMADIRGRLDNVTREASKANKRKAEYEVRVSIAETKKSDINNQIVKLREDYTALNEKTICPTCGQHFPDNLRIGGLNEIVAKAKEKKEEAAAYVRTIEHNKKLIEAEVASIDSLESLKADIEKEIAEVSAISINTLLSTRDDYNDIISQQAEVDAKHKELVDVETEKNRGTNSEVQELKREKAVIGTKISEAEGKIGQLKTNDRIDQFKKELEDERITLAQAIADCENVENQIAAYKKEYIQKVEQNVSSFFGIVRWKLYEQNLSNDGEKEICQAVIDGVPYEQQNKATQMNAAVDIIQGISSAIGYSVPLFIDNKESVSDLISMGGQVITMSVVPGSDLIVKLN